MTETMATLRADLSNAISRIDALEKTVAEVFLRLTAEPAPITKPTHDAGLAIVVGRDAIKSGYTGISFPGQKLVKPNTDELFLLHKIIMTAHPDLWGKPNPSQRDMDESFDYFGRAFLQLGCAYRVEKFDRTHNALTWMDMHYAWAKDMYGVGQEMTLFPLLAAALAHGDIRTMAGNPGTMPSLRSFNLSPHAGVDATDAWRKVLAAGKPIATIEPFAKG